MIRNDVHSPKNIMPEDYEFVCIKMRGEFGEFDYGETEIFRNHMKMTGGKFSTHKHGGNCQVCGAWMIDYAIFYHEKTNSYIRTGCDCAEKIEWGHKDEFRRAAQLRRAAEKRAAIVNTLSEELEELGILDFIVNLFHSGELGGPVIGYNVENPYEEDCWGGKYHVNYMREKVRHYMGDVVDEFDLNLLNTVEGKRAIITDIVRNAIHYKKSFSEKQAKFLVSLVDTMKNAKEIAFERKVEWEAAANAPTGKHTVTGEVLTTKVVESQFGISVKMLVKDDTGYKVWSTVPKAISEVEKGERVQFNANLEPSHDDPKFAFAKRPSKAKIL